MKTVIAGDLHAHNHEAYATILPNGRNSRLQNVLNCVDQAVELADGGVLVIAGDVYHDRVSLTHDVQDAVIDCLESAALRCERVIIPVGNHDQYRRNGSIHSLRALQGRPNIDVVDGPYCSVISDVVIASYPFTTDVEAARAFVHKITEERRTTQRLRAFQVRSPHLLVLHMPIVGADLGSGKLATAGLAVDDFDFSVWDAVIAGHYHKPQQLTNSLNKEVPCYYVGTPLALDWNEAGDKKRFLVFENGSVTSVPVQGMPGFRHTTLEEYQKAPSEYSGDYVEVEVDSLEDVPKDLPPNIMPVARSLAPEALAQPVDDGSGFGVASAVSNWLTTRKAERLISLANERMGI